MTRAPLFAGGQLRQARLDRGLTQAAAAAALGLSPSYYNQVERDRRPMTTTVLDRINAVFDIEPMALTTDTGGRLLAELRDALLPTAEHVTAGDLRDLVRNQPALAGAVAELHRRYVSATDRLAQATADHPSDRSTGQSLHEEVRDYFYRRHNHIAELETAAERTARTWALSPDAIESGLVRILAAKHGITVRESSTLRGLRRRFDPQTRELALPTGMTPSRRAFQAATQLALAEHSTLINKLAAADPELDPAARPLTRIGLAHYFAGALILPYRPFLTSAEACRYDIDALCQTYHVGFETVCHRLSTLQRRVDRGVPFFFVRTDRAGNISKRQSATTFHFSRTGGSCPLWIVHEAFDTPGRIRRQVAQLPDGRTYLWIARTVTAPPSSFHDLTPQFAIGLGCDIRHAHRLTYADGLDLTDRQSIRPIGPGCRTCERTDCTQRAFPMIGHTATADPNITTDAPYQ